MENLEIQKRSKSERQSNDRGHLQGCHVIEGMVQLLANGLVLQLLSIQFIWRSEVDRKRRQVPRTAATRKSEMRMRDRWEVQSRRRKEKTKIGQAF